MRRDRPLPDHLPRWLAAALVLAISGCGALPKPAPEPGDGPPTAIVDVSTVPDAVPRVEPRSRYGNPESYVVFGQRYEVLESSTGYRERGIASWYGSKFHGRRTSSGDPYDMFAMTAAHKSLPLPTYAEVTNLVNGRSIVVRINDRGPFKDDRLIDLSWAAAVRLGIEEQGTGLVEVRAIDPEAESVRVASVQPPPAAGATAAPIPAGIPAPIPTSIPAPPPEPALYLQIGAFGAEENAARLRARLEGGTATGVHVVRGIGDGGAPLYRVRIGPLRATEADRVSRELLAMGLEPHIVSD